MSAAVNSPAAERGSEMRLAYIVLAHECAEHVAGAVELLLSADPTGHVVVHLDRSAPSHEFSRLKERLGHSDRIHFVEARARSSWGQFGLVEAVVRALGVIKERKVDFDYALLMSGSCMPTKPISVLKRFLSENQGWEFIEAHSSDWMKDGLRDERYQYRHWLSYRKHPALFDANFRVQRALGLKRNFPRGLQPRFGSQWWCITRDAANAVLEFCSNRRRAYEFFKTTWIPDELFFQTLVASLMGESRVYGQNLTYFKFTSKGRPLTFYDDHLELVPSLPGFFARKISPTANVLKARLAEIAAEPDDGRPLPSLDKDATFDYERKRVRQVSNPRPGQLFYGGQAFSGWPSSLAASKVKFVVVHGPAPARRLVVDELKKSPGFTFLGRVFAPKEVKLDSLGRAFAGFGPEDAHIRDMDPPLYLSRLLERAEGVPVIEICPGDTPHGEGHFCFSDNAIFISCQPPKSGGSEARRRLYWTLVGAERGSGAIDYLAEKDGNPDRAKILDAFIEKFVPAEHMKWINGSILEDGGGEGAIHLAWGANVNAALKVVTGRSRVLRAKFGRRADLVTRALSAAAVRLAGARAVDLTEGLPVGWADHFSAGAGTTFENWAAALDQSTVGYAVLYGPAPVVERVRAALGKNDALTLLGRVFDPRDTASGDIRADGAHAEQIRRLRDRDRPLYLKRLLAEARSFPVIEVSPGDEPIGEGYLLSDPNAIVISCQPDMSKELNWHLYWTLAAVGHSKEAFVALEDARLTGNRLKALRMIIERTIPDEHRKWIDRALTGGASGAHLVKMWWRGATADDLPEFSPSSSLSGLRRTYGPQVALLEGALREVRKVFEELTVDQVTTGLPSVWRTYFCDDERLVELAWKLALRKVSRQYHVLQGPPRLTSEAADRSGGAYLGRLTSQNASCEDLDRYTRCQRAWRFAQQAADAEGLAVVEICPGDDPVAERMITGHEHAVIVAGEAALREFGADWTEEAEVRHVTFASKTAGVARLRVGSAQAVAK